MRVSKNSWHYRWMSMWGSYDFKAPQSLCGYFWTFVYNSIQGIGIISAGSFLVSIIPLLLWSWLRNGSPKAGAILLIMLAVAALIAVICGIAALADSLKYRSYDRPKKSGGAPGMLSITYQTAVAWKRKVCPLIEYTRE